MYKKTKWLKGIAYEVAFWNNVYRWNHGFRALMNWSNYGSVIDLELFDANQFLIGIDHPQVLDVGCGMSYATGNHVKREKILEPLDIHYVDPLAWYFNDILKRNNRNLPAITFGMMEYLSSFYPNHNIDLVIIQNALDHSSNPVKGIVEAINALRMGGILYLNHHPNEAETEHYKGFHQYNITVKDEQLVIWNKKENIIINDLLHDFASIEVRRNLETGHIIAIIKKTAEVPDELYNKSQDITELCESLIHINRVSQNFSHSLSFKLHYGLFNTIQFFAQMLTYDQRMKIKKLIKQQSPA